MRNTTISEGRLLTGLAVLASAIALTIVAGCASDSSEFGAPATATGARIPAVPTAVSNLAPTATYVLKEGDTLRISFPGSPNLNNQQQIRTDGKINLPLIGDVTAAGLTPDALQKKLMDLYAPQLTSKEVTVQVQSSSFPVYVTGAVLRPGKISSDHPITALEAIMEAGGFDYTRANLKNVEVIRQEGNVTKNYRLNLKQVMEGKPAEPFFMKTGDIIYVPEKFSWY